MMWRSESGVFRRLGFYETSEQTPKKWQKYADVLVPTITLSGIIVIGFYLHMFMTDPKAATGEYRSEIFALSSALLITSFVVFIYICFRLSTVLGGRTRLRLPIIRSNRSEACFLKSLNSDLEFMTPLNNHPITYESVIFAIPPYPSRSGRNAPHLSRIDSEDEGLKI